MATTTTSSLKKTQYFARRVTRERARRDKRYLLVCGAAESNRRVFCGVCSYACLVRVRPANLLHARTVNNGPHAMRACVHGA